MNTSNIISNTYATIFITAALPLSANIAYNLPDNIYDAMLNMMLLTYCLWAVSSIQKRKQDNE